MYREGIELFKAISASEIDIKSTTMNRVITLTGSRISSVRWLTWDSKDGTKEVDKSHFSI